MRLIIDTRETGSVAAELDILGTSYTIEPLNVGDFAIKDEADNAFIAVWERKSCADLAASINDGRYAEQKARLSALECRWKGYLLEGYYPESGIRFPTKGKTSVVPRSTIDSVKIGLMLRDGFTVYELSDAKHTAVFLTKMMIKLPEYLSLNVKTSYEESLIKSISTVRKENMTPEVCYIAQLCQIPGVSHTIAQAIQTVCPNMHALLNADENLAEIPVSANRRLGKVLAQRIYEYMGIGIGIGIGKTKPVIVKKIKDN